MKCTIHLTECLVPKRRSLCCQYKIEIMPMSLVRTSQLCRHQQHLNERQQDSRPSNKYDSPKRQPLSRISLVIPNLSPTTRLQVRHLILQCCKAATEDGKVTAEAIEIAFLYRQPRALPTTQLSEQRIVGFGRLLVENVHGLEQLPRFFVLTKEQTIGEKDLTKELCYLYL
jgi:hypothetical protein